jgi:hypothetical protein
LPQKFVKIRANTILIPTGAESMNTKDSEEDALKRPGPHHVEAIYGQDNTNIVKPSSAAATNTENTVPVGKSRKRVTIDEESDSQSQQSKISVQDEGGVKETSKETNNMFRDLDKYFIGNKLPPLGDEDFKYSATGLEVNKRLEVPIIIQSPNTTLTYEFRAEPSYIKFGVTFVAALREGETVDDLEVETVEELRLINSAPKYSGAVDEAGNDIHYSYQGSFTIGDEGIVFLIFDIDDSWSLFNTGTNTLTYNVKVKQPTFSYVDDLRCENSLLLLEEAVEDIALSGNNYMDSRKDFDRAFKEIEALEVKVYSLSKQVSKKQEERETLFTDMVQDVDLVDRGIDYINGLCIRLLNRHLLSHLFSYLIEPKPEEAAAAGALAAAAAGSESAKITGHEHDHSADLAIVCKYWLRITLSTRSFGPDARSVVPSADNPGFGPRWERGLELPFLAAGLTRRGMVEEKASDLIKEEEAATRSVTSDDEEHVMVVPREGNPTKRNTVITTTPGRELTTAENVERQKALQQTESDKAVSPPVTSMAKSSAAHKVVAREEHSSDISATTSSSSSSSSAVEKEDGDSDESSTHSSPVKTPTPFPRGKTAGPRARTKLHLGNGETFDLAGMGNTLYSQITKLAAKSERVYKSKKEVRDAIRRWGEAFAYQHNREPTVADKRKNAVAYDLYRRYAKLRDEIKGYQAQIKLLVQESTVAAELKI